MNLCILIPLLVGLISALLGYLLGKSGDSDKDKISKLEADLRACNNSKIGLESELKVAKATGSSNGGASSNEADISSLQSKNIALQNELNALKASGSGSSANVKNSLAATTSAEIDTLKSKIKSLESDLDAEKNKNMALRNEVNSLKSEASAAATSFASSATTTAVAFDADAAKSVFGKKIKQDDLTVVEGIGPKIQGLFHNHNVKTWLALSQCSVEKCQEVLDSGGSRFKMHKPTTWPKQAEYAANGKWAELKKWQDELDGGH